MLPQNGQTTTTGPEQQLLPLLEALDAGDLDQARLHAYHLHQRFPDYRLAQLLWLQLNAWLAGDHALLARLEKRHGKTLRTLIQEARVRWAHARRKLDPALWLPHVILSTGSQPWWVVVDLAASRLYLFHATPKQGLKMVQDVYVSKGEKGYGKEREGDRRTPVGLYRITGWMPGQTLPPLYGVGALPLNYPNAWDRYRGRTGSGIWLHGTPEETFVRPPQSSKGCVVMNNIALMTLRQQLKVPTDTPVILLDSTQQVVPLSRAARMALWKQVRAQLSDPAQPVELVQYPGEPDMVYVSWQKKDGHRVEQFWRWKAGNDEWQRVLTVGKAPHAADQSAVSSSDSGSR